MTNTTERHDAHIRIYQAARGLGRWHRRIGTRTSAEAAHLATAAHPELGDVGHLVRRGWNAEKAGR